MGWRAFGYEHLETVFADNKLVWHVYKKKTD